MPGTVATCWSAGLVWARPWRGTWLAPSQKHPSCGHAEVSCSLPRGALGHRATPSVAAGRSVSRRAAWSTCALCGETAFLLRAGY